MFRKLGGATVTIYLTALRSDKSTPTLNA